MYVYIYIYIWAENTQARKSPEGMLAQLESRHAALRRALQHCAAVRGVGSWGLHTLHWVGLRCC